MSQLPRLRSGLFFDRALTRRSLLFLNVPEAAASQPVHYLFQLQSPRAHSLMNPDIDNIIWQNFKGVVAYCTHPVLSGPAIENIAASALDELVVTDTIPLSDTAQACEAIRQLTVAELIGESINRITRGQSLSSMFID